MEVEKIEETTNEIQSYGKITGGLLTIPVLFVFLIIYFTAHFKGDILPSLLNLNLYQEFLPNMLPVVVFQVLSLTALFILLVSSVVLFFKKKANFKKVMIGLLCYYCAFLIIDYFWTNSVALYATPEIAENFNQPYRKLIYRSLMIGAIFIPYLMLSERVKRTFIK